MRGRGRPGKSTTSAAPRSPIAEQHKVTLRERFGARRSLEAAREMFRTEERPIRHREPHRHEAWRLKPSPRQGRGIGMTTWWELGLAVFGWTLMCFGLFYLGRWWERDHPEFKPGHWTEADIVYTDEETLPVRRGPYE